MSASALVISRLVILRSSSSLRVMASSMSLRMAASAPAAVRCSSSEAAMPLPQAENNSTEEKVYPGKITQIVDQIAHLNLLEVADLNELLKHRLNITDAPVMMAGNFSGGVGAAAPAEEDQEEEAPVAVQSSFTVHLEAFDAGKKVALIKELKNQLEGMNLVQAKKFVESAPAVVKADMSKDEAEALKKALVEAGGTCKID